MSNDDYQKKIKITGAGKSDIEMKQIDIAFLHGMSDAEVAEDAERLFAFLYNALPMSTYDALLKRMKSEQRAENARAKARAAR